MCRRTLSQAERARIGLGKPPAKSTPGEGRTRYALLGCSCIKGICGGTRWYPQLFCAHHKWQDVIKIRLSEAELRD